VGDADKAATDRHDPRDYLDRAEAALSAHVDRCLEEDPEWTPGLQTANVLASMATAAAMLMPTPEEVIATYEETRGEVLDEVQGDLVRRAHEAKRILEDAVRDGSRRHPAIHAALEALGDLDG
jgi:hypothetical protein